MRSRRSWERRLAVDIFMGDRKAATREGGEACTGVTTAVLDTFALIALETLNEHMAKGCRATLVVSMRCGLPWNPLNTHLVLTRHGDAYID